VSAAERVYDCEGGVQRRYTLPAQVVRKMLILTPFFEGPGEELRIPPSSVVASILMIQKMNVTFGTLLHPMS
jgi:hypothetical protein